MPDWSKSISCFLTNINRTDQFLYQKVFRIYHFFSLCRTRMDAFSFITNPRGGDNYLNGYTNFSIPEIKPPTRHHVFTYKFSVLFPICFSLRTRIAVFSFITYPGGYNFLNRYASVFTPEITPPTRHHGALHGIFLYRGSANTIPKGPHSRT